MRMLLKNLYNKLIYLPMAAPATIVNSAKIKKIEGQYN